MGSSKYYKDRNHTATHNPGQLRPFRVRLDSNEVLVRIQVLLSGLRVPRNVNHFSGRVYSNTLRLQPSHRRAVARCLYLTSRAIVAPDVDIKMRCLANFDNEGVGRVDERDGREQSCRVGDVEREPT